MARRRSPLRAPQPPQEDGAASLFSRVRRLVARGEARKAIVLLREACTRDEDAAVLWTQYGALLARFGRTDEAKQAYKHALYLRRRDRDDARVRTTEGLLAALAVPSAA